MLKPIEDKIDVAIILLNWNGNSDTIECLNSIKKYNQSLSLLVVLVDNDSKVLLTDAEVEAAFPGTVYIKNDKNDGFAGGNNLGTDEALKYNPKYVWLLNNDTALVDDSLTRIFHFMEANPDYGICGAVNYYYDEPEKIWQAGLRNNFKIGRQTPVEDFDVRSSVPVEVDYVPGSSLLVQAGLVKQNGLLDTLYFAYYEENDFCMRIKRAGYKVGFLPDTKILHKVSQTSYSTIKFYLQTRNRMVFYQRYAPKPWFVYILLKELVKSFVRAGIMDTKNKTSSYKKGYFWGFYDYFAGRHFEGSMNKVVAK